MREEAERMAAQDTVLSDFLHKRVLGQSDLVGAVTANLSDKLAQPDMPQATLSREIAAAFAADETIAQTMCEDIVAVHDRDRLAAPIWTRCCFSRGLARCRPTVQRIR